VGQDFREVTEEDMRGFMRLTQLEEILRQMPETVEEEISRMK